MKNKFKVVVTGAAGFIGSNLVDKLLEKGYEVIGIDNLSRGTMDNLEKAISNPSFQFINADIRDEDLSTYFAGVDTIFHLAALARIQPSIKEPDLYHDNNVNGTYNLLTQAVKAGVRRIVYSSSSSVYGVQEDFPEQEDAILNPLNPYAGGKLQCEIDMRVFANCYDIETVCLRYFNVYGPRQTTDGAYATVIGIFLKQVAEGQPMSIYGSGWKKRDFTWIGDVCRANILASKSKKVGKGESINIGTGHNYSIIKVANLIGKNKEFLPDRIFEAKQTLADISKAEYLLGWVPEVSLEQGIKKLKETK